MEQENFGQKAIRKTKSFFKKLLLTVILLGVIFFAFTYWFTYESGTMAGKVLRVSEKGFIFKTYEGKLNAEAFGALKGTSPLAETYDFSVSGGDKETVKLLEAVALSGERVNLHYKKHLIRYPWRGETNVYVYQVERLK